MRTIIIAYTVLYLAVVLGAATYSLVKTKRMNGWRFAIVLVACGIIAASLWSYAFGYQPWQMLGFALPFTVISSLFLFNGLVGERPSFAVFFGLSALRLFIHLQLLFFLYLFR